MSFLLVPHLPRLVAMLVKFFMCEGTVSNLIYYFLVLFYLFIFISSHGKQPKMLKSDPLQPDDCKLCY